MNKKVLTVLAAIVVVALIGVAAYIVLTGPHWDDPVDDWVLEHDVSVGDYIEYEEKFTVVSIDGDTCTVKKTGPNGESTQSMSKKEFLNLLSAKEQMKLYFDWYSTWITMNSLKQEITQEGTVKTFDGSVDTNKFEESSDYDMSIYVGSHNILQGWSVKVGDGYKSFGLKTNLPFIKY